MTTVFFLSLRQSTYDERLWANIPKTAKMRLLTSKLSVRSALSSQRVLSQFAARNKPLFISIRQFAMKRSAATAELKTNTKSPKKSRSLKASPEPGEKLSEKKLPEYHETPSRKDEHGEIIWPAPNEQMQAAQEFILEW
jgi:hypothetical protein